MRLRKTAPQPGGHPDQSAQVHPVAVIVVIVLSLVFNHWTWRRPQEDDAIDEALAYGAVAVGRPADR